MIGALGGEIEATGDREFHRDVPGDLAGQAEQTTGRCDEVPLHLGDAEHGRARRDHEIARQHQLGSAGERRTVDGGDERLGALAMHEAAEPATLALLPTEHGRLQPAQKM